MLHLLAADTTTDVPLVVPWAAMVEALIIPLLVALVAKQHSKPAVKGFLTVLLSAIGAAATVYVDTGGSAPFIDLVSAFFVIVAGAHTAHMVVFKPFGITGDTGAIQKAVPQGLG